MDLFRKLAFWILTLIFVVSNFIRLFVNSNRGQAIKDFFSQVPIGIRILILVIYIMLLIWLYPYRKQK